MLPGKIESYIGKSGEPFVLYVEKGAVRKYVDAVQDRNPLYWDDNYALCSQYKGNIAPPGFYGWPVKWSKTMPFFSQLRQELSSAISAIGFSQVIDGGIEFDFLRPVYVGDVLTAFERVTEIKEREGKHGTMLVFVLETTYLNQNGDVVGKSRKVTIQR